MTVAEEIRSRIDAQLAALDRADAEGDDVLVRGLLGQLQDLREEQRLIAEADHIRWTPWDDS